MSKEKEFISDEEKVVFPDLSKEKSPNEDVSDISIKNINIKEKNSAKVSDAPKVDISKENPTKKSVEKPKRKSLIMRFSTYIIMNLLTFGIWARFKPLRQDIKGGWFLFAFFLLIINGALVTERFFKSEFNEKVSQQFGESAVLIPEKLFFEDESSAIDYKSKYEEELSLHKETISKYDKTSKELSLIQEKEDNSGSINLIKDKLIQSEIKNANLKEKSLSLSRTLEEELNKPPVAPDMAFLSFNDLDSIVGCSSKFAERKKKDIYSSDYHEKWVKFNMIISKIHEESIELKNEADVSLFVELAHKGTGYELLVDDKVDITFTLNGLGNCDIPYTGVNGAINF